MRRSTRPSSASSASSKPAATPPPKRAKKQLVFELSQSFFELLLRHRTHYVGAVSDENIPPMQAAALHYLAQSPCTMSDLARAMSIEPSSLTGIIDKLEARGLAVRRESSTDRRSKTVSLTPEGLAMQLRLVQAFCEPAPWMLALTVEDQKRLLDIVRKAIDFEKSIEAAPPKAPPRAAAKPAGHVNLTVEDQKRLLDIVRRSMSFEKPTEPAAAKGAAPGKAQGKRTRT